MISDHNKEVISQGVRTSVINDGLLCTPCEFVTTSLKVSVIFALTVGATNGGIADVGSDNETRGTRSLSPTIC